MQAGSLTGGDVQSFSLRVLVNGVERPAISWSADRELASDMPVQVVSASGITQATGTVEWASDNDVSDGGLNPWNSSTGWIPSRGDRVEIFVGDGGAEWKLFHGLIDETTGSINGGFQSKIIDDYDQLSATVSHRAMLRVMPPLAWDGSEPYRSVGLHPIYYLDYALRAARFYSTPPREQNANLYAPMQGSLWPHWGQLRSANLTQFTTTPWGMGVKDFSADYDPALSRTMSQTTQLSMMVAPDHAGLGVVRLEYGGSSARLSLSVQQNREAIASVNGTEICRLALGSSRVVSLLAKNGAITLRSGNGVEASGGFAAVGGSISLIRVSADSNSNIGAVQVSHPTTTSYEHFSTRWVPSAVFDSTSLKLAVGIDAGPNIEGQKASELVSEINSALLGAMWIDEVGVMRWKASDALREQVPVRTLTTHDDVTSLDWQDGLLATASKVTVSGSRPSISRGRWRNMVLARGGSDSIKSGDELEIFLEPESDEDWIMPAFDTLQVGGSANIWGPANNPAYSLTGLYFTSDGGTTSISGLSCAITTQEVGYQKLMVKYVAGDWPSDVEGVLATSPTNELVWPKNRNQPLPRLIGRGKIKWSDQEVVATGAGGPGPELRHDTSFWANRTDDTLGLDRIATYIQAQATTPQPVISGMTIVPDPRLQLGDVVKVESPSLLGVTLTALVVGVSNSYSDRLDQSLSVRVISATSTFATYAEFNSAGGSLTYQQWQALGPAPQSYEQFNVD